MTPRSSDEAATVRADLIAQYEVAGIVMSEFGWSAATEREAAMIADCTLAVIAPLLADAAEVSALRDEIDEQVAVNDALHTELVGAEAECDRLRDDREQVRRRCIAAEAERDALNERFVNQMVAATELIAERDRLRGVVAAVEKLCDEAEAVDMDAPWCPDEPPERTRQRNLARINRPPQFGVTTAQVRAALAAAATPTPTED